MRLDRRERFLEALALRIEKRGGALWRSFETYEGRASLRTWTYRVAHNAATTHVLKDMRSGASKWVDLEAAADAPDPSSNTDGLEAADLLARLMALIRTLKPPDRQLMLLYLDDLDAAAIGEITGLSPGAVATKIHRIKAVLAKRFNANDPS